MIGDTELTIEQTIAQAETDIDATMGIMRSAVVCLHMLLKNYSSVNMELLSSQVDGVSSSVRGVVVNDNTSLVEELPNILFTDRFEEFRQNFTATLRANGNEADANCFEERLAIARSLPETTKVGVRGIISVLQAGLSKAEEFFYKLFAGGPMEQEHSTTNNACMELVGYYLPYIQWIYPHNVSHHHHHHHHHHGHSEVPQDCPGTPPEEPSSVYADTFMPLERSLASNGGSQHSGRNYFQKLELLNKRMQVMQAFTVGVPDLAQPEYCWMFKEMEVPSLEKQCIDYEVDKILEFAAKLEDSDPIKNLPYLMLLSDCEFVSDFKSRRLCQVKIEQRQQLKCKP